MKFLLFFIVFMKTIYASDLLEINFHKCKSYSQENEIINPNRLLCCLRNNTQIKISFSFILEINKKKHFLNNRVFPQKTFNIFLNDLCDPLGKNSICLKQIRLHKSDFSYTINTNFNIFDDYILYINFDNNKVLNIYKSYIFENIVSNHERRKSI